MGGIKKVLVVEDEIKIANMIKRVIEMDDTTNFNVDLAHDGKKGLLMAENNDYDLILLDIMLPKLNGLEICKALRYDDIKTPVIMLTAKDTIEDRLEATEAGADDYLSKPFSFDELLVKMDGLIKSKNRNVEEIEQIKNDIFLNVKEDDIKSAKIHKRILENIPVSIVTIDKDGNMTSATNAFKNFSRHGDYRKNNVFTGKFFIRENLVNDYKKLLSDGTMIKRDHCYEINSKGEEKYLKIIAVPLLDTDGNIEGALSMAMDNTESVLYKKKLQLLNNELEEKIAKRTEELKKANEQIENVMEMKSIFIADVSHEMRTALAIIQGNIELMVRGLVQAHEQAETYEHIFAEITRISNMLADMTLLSESEISKQKLDLASADINQIISKVCRSLKVTAEKKNIKMCHKKSKTKVELIVDSTQIEKLCLNLITNAIRYNKENGTISIWVEAYENHISINVKDTGVGIEQKYIDKIFERFYRVDKSRSRNEGGSGLGLAICKWIAEVHGGKIEVLSELGKGSLFTVLLPRMEILKTEPAIDNIIVK